MPKNALLWTIILGLVACAACAPVRRPSTPPEASESAAAAEAAPAEDRAAMAEEMEPERFEGSLPAARNAKYVEMYRRMREAQARADDLERQLRASEGELAQVRAELDMARGGPGASGLPSSVGLDEPGAGSMPEDEAGLRRQLTLERRRSQRLHAELMQLREETSAGPFETSDELPGAEMGGDAGRLRAALAQERRARAQLEAKYRALQEYAEAPVADAESETLREEMAQLRARQQETLASLRRELEESREEVERLRSGAPVAAGGEDVMRLRQDLEEARERNQRLEAKLRIANRVTDMIFRMQEQGQR